MKNRLKVSIPPAYKASDFSVVIDQLKKKYSTEVKAGRIEMRMFAKSIPIMRFGKKFTVDVWAFLGHLSITISEDEPSL